MKRLDDSQLAEGTGRAEERLQDGKRYRRGYVAGVFDLFHVGHLNLIRNAKVMCEYLIVGVLEDELVIRFKKNPPIIPQKERMEIVGALKDVNEVVLVHGKNIEKLEAWKQVRYDCLFSGDDYINHPSWIRDRKRLNEVGADICFFPYTQSTSSTKIKRILNQEEPLEDQIFIYGAGTYGCRALEYYGRGGVVGFIDQDESKMGTLVCGKPVLDIKKMGRQLNEEQKIVIALKEGKETAAEELKKATRAQIDFYI